MDQEFHWSPIRRKVRAPFSLSLLRGFYLSFNPEIWRFPDEITRRADRAHPLFSFHFRVIEDNTLKSCPDLIVECIAVGNGRPSPALLIELGPGAAALGDADSIKRDVYRRIRHFQSRRLAHERIGSVEVIVIIQRTAWPRTPVGHVRRTDAEQKFRGELDRAYAAASIR